MFFFLPLTGHYQDIFLCVLKNVLLGHMFFFCHLRVITKIYFIRFKECLVGTYMFFCHLNVITKIYFICFKGCPVGTYGFQCQQSCSSNCMSQPCEPDFGHCIGSCKAGFVGDRCDRGK